VRGKDVWAALLHTITLGQICPRMSEVSSSDIPSTSPTPPGSRFQGETFLDLKGWREEAKGVIKEIVDYVKLFVISEMVPSSDKQIFLNLITLEDQSYTIRLNEQGFSVVGEQLDTVEKEGETFYETPHSLLDNISKGYRQAWGDHLALQLLKLQAEREDPE